MDLLIHKINITDEAKFDYETSISPNFCFIQKDLKEQLETYIQHNLKLWYKHYFRLKYYDEISDNYLMIFIKPDKVLLSMKMWKVIGICLYDNWNEDLEEDGQIRSWLDTCLIPNPNEKDWVEILYRNKILLALDLVYDIGGYNDYIRTREELARRLSNQYRKNKPIEPSRLKSFIKKTSIDSKTANGILEYLDEMLEQARTRINKDDFYR